MGSQTNSALAENLSSIDGPGFEVIDQLLTAGQFAEAASLCGNRIASHPDDHIPYLHLGRLAEIAGDYQKSAEFFAEAIVRNVECGAAYWNLSRMFRNLGQLPHAVRSLQVAMGMNAAGPEAQLDLADMLFEMGDAEGAKAAYTSALETNPDCGRSKAILKLLRQNADAASPTIAPSSAAPLSAAWRNVHISVVAPEGYVHSQGFGDIAQAFAHSFGELGATCSIGQNEIRAGSVNVLFGAHLIQSQDYADSLPPTTIVFNLEQIGGFGLDRLPIYKSLLSRLTVWDYSPRNIEKLAALTGSSRIHHVGIGFAQNMARIPAAWQQPTDVLFYGSMNERRRNVLDALRAAGLSVQHLFGVYGDALDIAISTAKVVLNMHFYEDSIHEIVRTSYLLANRKAVVTECNATTEIDPEIRLALRAVPYTELAGACIDLVRSDASRRALEQRGFDIFSHRRQAALLRSTIEQTIL